MKVLLKEDIENLGYAGEVCKVANGYGRNYLLPNGLAEVASPTAMKKAESWRKRAETRRQEQKAEFDELAEKIEAVTLEFTARASDAGRLYGSVTTLAITERLNEELGTSIDRRMVGKEPLRQLGEHKVVVILDRDHKPNVNVLIKSTDGVAEALAAQREMEAAEAEAAAEAGMVFEPVEEIDELDKLLAGDDDEVDADSAEENGEA